MFHDRKKSIAIYIVILLKVITTLGSIKIRIVHIYTLTD